MRARSLLPFVLACGVVASQGCGSDFDPGSRLTSLRVIAVRAGGEGSDGQAYAKPGETVSLQAEWFAPKSDVRPRQWIWARCIDPDDTSVVGCFKSIGEEVQASGDVTKAFLNVPAPGVDQDTATVTVPDDAISRLDSSARNNATIGIVLLVCPGTLKLLDLTTITTGQIPLECDEAGTGNPLPLDQWVAGIKRIFLRNSQRNANPQIASITWDGKDWNDKGSDGKPIVPVVQTIKACGDDGNRYDRCSDDQHQIHVTLTDDSFESGTDSDTGTSFTEQLVVEFYATEGLFEHDVKIGSDASTGFAARKQSATADQPLKLFIVVHDNRGGVTWKERLVQVQ